MLNTVVFTLMGIGLAAGSVLHGLLFLLLLAGGVHFGGLIVKRSKAAGGAFPGGCIVRHAKLALPALALVVADAAIAFIAFSGMNA